MDKYFVQIQAELPKAQYDDLISIMARMNYDEKLLFMEFMQIAICEVIHAHEPVLNRKKLTKGTK